MTRRAACLSVLAGALALGLASGACLAQEGVNLGTATPYHPQQDAGTYQRPPDGFEPVFTQLLARHGSRGLSAPKLDLALYNMWQQAKAANALTALGAKLGPDLERTMRANALLGYGVPGIGKPGYGNETKLGSREHAALAQRMLARLPGLWKVVGDDAARTPRHIVVVNSGVERAGDSAGFFVRSMTAIDPSLARLVTREPAPAGYPANAPRAQPIGTNRFLLYFHKLTASTDLVTDPRDGYFQTYRDSQAYQQYLKSSTYTGKHSATVSRDAGKIAGRAVLERLFATSFVDRLEAAGVAFANTGTRTFISEDGKYTARVTGDGKTKIKTAANAALYIYQLYGAGVAIAAESGVDWTPYLSTEHANYFAAMEDALGFYRLGPGIAEEGDITYRMAKILLDDFFHEVDAIARGDLKHAAKLRFAHAEIVAPFLSRMELGDSTVQVPDRTVFSYRDNPWRGAHLLPMAANIQWDVFADGRGGLLVRMLHNERETDFKAACASAKLAPDSRYYDFRKLSACYGYQTRS
jgi:hypothetical protein